MQVVGDVITAKLNSVKASGNKFYLEYRWLIAACTFQGHNWRRRRRWQWRWWGRISRRRCHWRRWRVAHNDSVVRVQRVGRRLHGCNARNRQRRTLRTVKECMRRRLQIVIAVAPGPSPQRCSAFARMKWLVNVSADTERWDGQTQKVCASRRKVEFPQVRSFPSSVSGVFVESLLASLLMI